MIFFDTSALIPLLVDEPATARVRAALGTDDEGMVVWWGTEVECLSAVARRERDGGLRRDDAERARANLRGLSSAWYEIAPQEPVRILAGRLLRTHPLRAADALQLAAALVWAGGVPEGQRFATLDRKLAITADLEGFGLLFPPAP